MINKVNIGYFDAIDLGLIEFNYKKSKSLLCANRFAKNMQLVN